jgi:hypothetical protein
MSCPEKVEFDWWESGRTEKLRRERMRCGSWSGNCGGRGENSV